VSQPALSQPPVVFDTNSALTSEVSMVIIGKFKILGISKYGTRSTWYNTPTDFNIFVRTLLQNTHVDKNHAYDINLTNNSIFKLHFRSHQGYISEECQQMLILEAIDTKHNARRCSYVLSFPNKQNNSQVS
jgi:hypothetical protein